MKDWQLIAYKFSDKSLTVIVGTMTSTSLHFCAILVVLDWQKKSRKTG